VDGERLGIPEINANDIATQIPNEPPVAKALQPMLRRLVVMVLSISKPNPNRNAENITAPQTAPAPMTLRKLSFPALLR